MWQPGQARSQDRILLGSGSVDSCICHRQDYHPLIMNTRRQFLITMPAAALAAGACGTDRQTTSSVPAPSTAGAPPTFGTGPVSGPPVSPTTFAEAEKLAQVTMTDAERERAAASCARSV